MSSPGEPYPDPLIDEVRQRRRELLAEYGNDLGKLFEAIQKIEAEHPEKVLDPRKRKLAETTSPDAPVRR
jgi:hypothetical protein